MKEEMKQRIGIIYGSTTTNSERIAETIWDIFKESELHDIKDGVGVIEQYEKVILCAPTWDYGALQEDYIDAWDDLTTVNWSNKTVALVGLGDQVGYPALYQDAMAKLYNMIEPLGAKCIGFTSTKGHTFTKSDAVKDDKFVGLAIDEDCQRELTEERLNTWTKQISFCWDKV